MNRGLGLLFAAKRPSILWLTYQAHNISLKSLRAKSRLKVYLELAAHGRAQAVVELA